MSSTVWVGGMIEKMVGVEKWSLSQSHFPTWRSSEVSTVELDGYGFQHCLW